MNNLLKAEALKRKNVMQYLRNREKKLRQIHPQWDFTKQQISASNGFFNRDETPICIPPSWDVIKKYAGAVDKTADGYNPDFYNYGLQYFAGDHGEAAVLSMMQNSKIGGLLIGNLDSRHMVRETPVSDPKVQDYLLPNELRVIVEEAVRENVPERPSFKRQKRPTKTRNRRMSSEKDDSSSPNDDGDDAPAQHYFEIDFVIVHPTFGMYQLEVKTIRKPNRAKLAIRLGFGQLNRNILKSLFIKFCKLLFKEENAEQLWNNFYTLGGLVLVPKFKQQNEEETQPCTSGNELVPLIQKYKGPFDFFRNSIDELEHKIQTTIRSENFFAHDVYKNFVVFLSGFRPDFFISPALCAIQTRDSIVTQKISALRFYNTEEDCDRAKSMRFDISAGQSLGNCAAVQKEICGKVNTECLLKSVYGVRQLLKSADVDSKAAFNSLKKNIDKQIEQGSELAQVVNSQVELIVKTIFTPDNIQHMMKKLKKDVCSGLVNSVEIDALSAANYLFDLKKKGFIKHSDIVFMDGRRDIYFTRKQLEAIDIFNDDGSMKNQQQIITGPPGTGKSLILMMKLFLLKQVRPNKKLAFASWFKHDYVVKDFLKRNACNCCRKVEFFSEHGLAKRLLGKDRPIVKFGELERGAKIEDERFNETRELSKVLMSHEYDVVLDERHSQNCLERFKKSGNVYLDVFSVAAITGGYKLLAATPGQTTMRRSTNSSNDSAFSDESITDSPAWMSELELIAPFRLETVFRSTNHIKRYVTALLDDQKVISGHNFEGVPVEEYLFTTEETAFKAASSRITQLNDLMGKFSGTRQIALIAEDPQSFTAFLAYGSCLPHTELPQCANDVPSLEFPIVVVICSCKSAPRFLPISASRAICHLIVFQYEQPRGRKS